MNIKVLYHSQTGNTKRVAESMAETLGVAAEEIAESSIAEPVDILFIGDGIYAGRPDKVTISFIKTLNESMVRNAAVFGTYAGQENAIKIMKEQLKEQGIKVLPESFGCKGKFCALINRKHPSEKDLAAAKEYAMRISKEINNTH